MLASSSRGRVALSAWRNTAGTETRTEALQRIPEARLRVGYPESASKSSFSAGTYYYHGLLGAVWFSSLWPSNSIIAIVVPEAVPLFYAPRPFS